MNTLKILLRHGYVSIPDAEGTSASMQSIATILMNLQYYGYGLSPDTYKSLCAISEEQLKVWWPEVDKNLSSLTGDDRKMDDFVVYKNFPGEVLSKSEFEYWLPQILMYWGFPNEYFTEPVKARPNLNPNECKTKKLLLSNDRTIIQLLNSQLLAKNAWKPEDLEEVLYLSKDCYIDFSTISFKTNMVLLAKNFVERGVLVKVKNATDVLRLGAGLSDGDVSLRTNTDFISFSKKTRRYLIDLLEGCSNLSEDISRRKGKWKKFLHNLHPNDYKKSCPKLSKVLDELYNDKLEKTFQANLESYFKTKDSKALDLLVSRPGEFLRRIVHVVELYGQDAVDSFISIIPKLNLRQIVGLKRFLEHGYFRKNRVFPPKGSYTFMKIGDPRPMDIEHVATISIVCNMELSSRVPKVSILDPKTVAIKLPNGDEGSYSRGTKLFIPDDVNFIRTASYWENKTIGNNWFDNTWNFFDENWEPVDYCSWINTVSFQNKAAVFSGDPTNSKTSDGKACQLIDIYIDKLVNNGVRYAVWSILCYSHIKFSEAKEAFAALQWGTDPNSGKLFEPSRAQIAFPLKGDCYSKYIACIDLVKREVIYLDFNLSANLSLAGVNGPKLSKNLPAYLEHIDSIPSVYDLFSESIDSAADGAIVYSSKETSILQNTKAYVFVNDGETDFNPIDINNVLSG